MNQKYKNYGESFYIDSCYFTDDSCLISFEFYTEYLTPIIIHTIPDTTLIIESGIIKIQKVDSIFFYEISGSNKFYGGLDYYYPKYKYFVIDKSKKNKFRKFESAEKRNKKYGLQK